MNVLLFSWVQTRYLDEKSRKVQFGQTIILEETMKVTWNNIFGKVAF